MRDNVESFAALAPCVLDRYRARSCRTTVTDRAFAVSQRIRILARGFRVVCRRFVYANPDMKIGVLVRGRESGIRDS